MQSLSTWILLENLLKSIFFAKTVFTLTVFEMLLFESRSILWPAQQVTGKERVKFPVTKNKKNAWLLLELLEKWLHYKLRRFEWFLFFIFYLILCNSFGTGKIEKLDFLDSSNSTNFKHQLLENQKYKNY